MSKAEKVETVIVEAAGTASAGGGEGLGARLQAAMEQAVVDCFAEGVTDDESVLAAKQAARARVKAEYAAEQSG